MSNAYELVAEVRRAIAATGDPARALAQQAYMKSTMPYQGITSAELKALLRPIMNDRRAEFPDQVSWSAAILDLWDDAVVREHRYAALAVARHRGSKRWRTPGTLTLYEHLIVTGAWWDLVDDTASHLVGDLLRRYPCEVAPTIYAWTTTNNLWLRRASLICQLGRKQATDLDLLTAAVIRNLEGTESAGPNGRQDFFIRKAIGWALRDYSRTDPDWVRRFVEAHRPQMAGLTIREALSHVRSPV